MEVLKIGLANLVAQVIFCSVLPGFFCGLNSISAVKALSHNYSVYDDTEPSFDLNLLDVVLAEAIFLISGRLSFYGE